MNSNSYFNAFILVFLAGLLWSFGPVAVRYMIDGHSYVFQYLFYRGFSIATILIIYLFILSILLELFHIFIPNRSFEISDLFGNIIGVVVVIVIYKIKKKYE